MPDTSTTTTKKYLDLEGLGHYDTLLKSWVKELDEPIDQKFVVNNAVGAIKEGTVINSTDTIAGILIKMLQSVKDATVASNPSCTISNTGTAAGKSYEVGTTINTALSCKYTDGTFNSYKDSVSTEKLNAGCVQTGPTYTKGSAAYTADSFVLASGANVITGSYTYSKSTVKPKKSDMSESAISIAAGSCESKLTWTGYYCRFEGKFENGALPSSFTRENLTNKGQCVKGDITGITMPVRYYVIAIPNEFSIAAAVNVDSANASIMGSIMEGYPKQINMGDAGTGTHAYKLYIFDAGAGSGSNQIKITLK